MTDCWVCGITGCNKREVTMVQCANANQMLDLVTELGGDSSMDLHALEMVIDDLDDMDSFIPLDNERDLPDVVWKCFRIAADDVHVCPMETRVGRRLYCVQKGGHTISQIMGWIKSTVC